MQQIGGEQQAAYRAIGARRTAADVGDIALVMVQVVARGLLIALLAAPVAIGFLAATRSSVAEKVQAVAEEALIAAGLGLDVVTVSGQRFTADSDVFDCLGLASIRTLVALPSLSAKACIEALPWVATASLTRAYPGALDIAIRERTPFAVWRPRSGEAGPVGTDREGTDSPERWVLVDETGRQLTAVPADHAPSLLRLSGDGAPDSAPALLAALRQVPEIANRLDLAERIDGRRWSLVLSGNVRIELPSEGEATALIDLSRHGRAAGLLASGNIVIDVRSRFEIATRPAPPVRAAGDQGG